ncbi:MAG: hypothetical protein H0V70_05705 [Ktedonobacteraceae bacterium]|nr:hypothetical protein [Ktedonobacteraceae bacterium]
MADALPIDQVRKLARDLLHQVQQDPQFAAQVLQDPVTVLADAGLPEEFAQEFLAQAQLAEVQGYLSPSCGLTVLF